MRVIDQATRDAFVGIQQLIADYWDEVDANDAARAAEFYTETCTFAPGAGKVFEGRSGVLDFYQQRAKRGKRTTRHVGLNLTLTLDTEDQANGAYVVALYAGDGPEPIVDILGPSVVMDLKCTFERGQDGQWRFKTVHGTPLFIGSEPFVRASLTNSEN